MARSRDGSVAGRAAGRRSRRSPATGRTDYDWRAFEKRFAALPHFVTEIDGVDIHFIHVRSTHEDALPLIVTHGWPGSTIEQLKIIEPLTDPTTHGAERRGRLPSRHPVVAGPRLLRQADRDRLGPGPHRRAWVVLMERLGYERYVAQGGDWGNAVTEQLALLKPAGLLGIHTNMPATLPPEVSQGARLRRSEARPACRPTRTKAFDILKHFFATGIGYAQEMGIRPQTLYAIEDSPVGLAAWMIDHDERSYELIERAFVGQAGGLSRDDVLDNVTHYWLTKSGISAARLYWESHLGFFDIKGVDIPVGVTVFPDELYPAPRSWAEKAYPKLIHYNRVAEGGHFAAWEQPRAVRGDPRDIPLPAVANPRSTDARSRNACRWSDGPSRPSR